MSSEKKDRPEVKTSLHPRNKHRGRYDFERLTAACPELTRFVAPNKYGDASIDFFDPIAVRMLNKALLKSYYAINGWTIPQNYLCPPIPGRADYLHHAADLLFADHPDGLEAVNRRRHKIRVLDIGTGASAIYPLLGNRSYGWRFVGSDTDPIALRSARAIVDKNPEIKVKVDFRLQPSSEAIFQRIIREGERYELTVCNPPFHASRLEAEAGSTRKLRNLKAGKLQKAVLNFGGKSNELWCEGGEVQFVSKMIAESKEHADACLWFTTLIAKQDHLPPLYNALRRAKAADVQTVKMGTGNKITRFLAWTFQSDSRRKEWMAKR